MSRTMQLTKFRLDLWRSDSRYGSCVHVGIHAEYPNPEAYDGKSWISFIATEAEMRGLLQGKIDCASDGYHKLATFDDRWTFYDLENIPRADFGKMEVRFANVTVPRRVREILLDCVTEMVAEYDAQPLTSWGDRNRVARDLTSQWAGWAADFGRGKGKLLLIADSEIRDRLGSFRGEATFDRSWETIEAIARNTTHAVDDVAEIRVSRDSCGFFWVAGGMHGGLINHGTAEQPDWSIHT